jgi:hypothetical protein
MPNIDLNEINWLAVLVAGLAAFLLGGLWYGPLFSKPWIKAQGWSDEKVAELKAKMSPAKFFGGMIVSYFIMATALALIASAADVDTLVEGLCLGSLIWVITACLTMTHQLASGRHINAYFVDASFELIYLLMMGAIIGAWH